jgi:hypothetical protein
MHGLGLLHYTLSIENDTKAFFIYVHLFFRSLCLLSWICKKKNVSFLLHSRDHCTEIDEC